MLKTLDYLLIIISLRCIYHIYWYWTPKNPAYSVIANEAGEKHTVIDLSQVEFMRWQFDETVPGSENLLIFFKSHNTASIYKTTKENGLSAVAIYHKYLENK